MNDGRKGSRPVDLREIQAEQMRRMRRDMFAASALTGICGTPMIERAAGTPSGPSEVGMLAMFLADATINALDRVGPPKQTKIVGGSDEVGNG